MTTLARNRLIWKDCRELFPLYIAGCVTFLIVIVLNCFSWSGGIDVAIIERLMLPVRLCTSLCGILLGVLLFAPERENRTSLFLAGLPFSGWKISLTKFLLGLIGLSLFVAFCYATISLVGVLYSTYEASWPPRSEVLSDLVLPFLCFALGIFWSTRSKSSLTSLVAAAFSMMVIEAIVHNAFSGREYWWAFAGVHAVAVGCLRLAALFVILIASAVALPGWLQDQQLTLQSLADSSTRRLRKGRGARRNPSDQARGALNSLVWQTFRKSRWYVLGGLVACIMLAVVQSQITLRWQFNILIVSFLIPFAFACTAFMDDNYKQRYRFFQQHVEFGRQLWFARLLPPLLMVLAVTFFSMTFFDHAHSYFGRGSYFDPAHVVAMNLTPLGIFLILFTGMALGQFFSMMIPSPVVSVGAALAYAFVMVAWSSVLLVSHASLVWFLLPVAIASLYATWHHAPNWLAEKTSPFKLSLPWTVFFASIIAVAIGFACFRVYEIPAIPGIDRATYMEAFEVASGGRVEQVADSIYEPELRTAVLYRKGLDSLKAVGEESTGALDALGRWGWGQAIFSVEQGIGKNELNRFVESNNRALEFIHQASEGNKPYAFLDPTSYLHSLREMHKIKVLLIAEYRYWREEGDLDKALKSLFALFRFEQSAQIYGRMPDSLQLFYEWSELPNQDSEAIQAAIRRLDTEMHQLFSHATRMRKEFSRLAAQGHLAGAVSGNEELTVTRVPPIYSRVLQWLPWEAERSRRASNFLIEFDCEIKSKPLSEILDHPRHCLQTRGDLDEKLWYWWDLDWLDIPLFARTTLALNEPSSLDSTSFSSVLVEIQLFRYCKVRMALNAYRLENGSYPTTLGELVPKYIEAIPCDAFSGGDFFYTSTGLSHPALKQHRFAKGLNSYRIGPDGYGLSMKMSEYAKENLIPKEMPFILPWSSNGGQTVQRIRIDREAEDLEPEFVDCFQLSDPDGAVAKLMQRYRDVTLPRCDLAKATENSTE